MVVIDDEPTSKRRDATCASRPEKSVPTKLTFRPSLSAIARSSSLSKPVNWPLELMQMLGGASDSVPTVRVPGVPRPSASMLTEFSGSTVGVVYLSRLGALGRGGQVGGQCAGAVDARRSRTGRRRRVRPAISPKARISRRSRPAASSRPEVAQVITANLVGARRVGSGASAQRESPKSPRHAAAGAARASMIRPSSAMPVGLSWRRPCRLGIRAVDGVGLGFVERSASRRGCRRRSTQNSRGMKLCERGSGVAAAGRRTRRSPCGIRYPTRSVERPRLGQRPQLAQQCVECGRGSAASGWPPRAPRRCR